MQDLEGPKLHLFAPLPPPLLLEDLAPFFFGGGVARAGRGRLAFESIRVHVSNVVSFSNMY